MSNQIVSAYDCKTVYIYSILTLNVYTRKYDFYTYASLVARCTLFTNLPVVRRDYLLAIKLVGLLRCRSSGYRTKMY